MAFDLDNISSTKKEKLNTSSDINSLLKKEINLFGTKFSNKQKEGFYTELSVLLKAGISLKDALVIIYENEKKKPLQTFFKNIIDNIVAGNSFSGVIKEVKEFSEYEFHSLKIGEETGMLAEITEELGVFFMKKNEQRRKLIAALTYPAIILTTAVAVVVFMLRLVVPMFHDIFSQNQVELPWVTKMIIKLSALVEDYGWFFILFFILIIVVWKMISKKTVYKKWRDIILLKIPFIGPFYKNVYLSQFTQAVALLTFSKVPVVNSIQLVEKMIDFYPLQQALKNVENDILKGSSLSQSLKNTSLFDNKMISLVKVAEETNQTELIFQKLHQQYTIEVDQKSKVLSTIMEPFIILAVGIIVGVILIAMYLPMFKLSSVLG
ncbi:type II secretion system F family protein [Galbibacter sp. EGI 63066]|uniref:type II secretion system F family protein n=1 Tax=Galbibacter sp. EGI 63066 TaxID=2993559 RepID=UPI0022493649|nr:type II secretion system F family protein [Galbibacter sp. EGI 63066]MCX2680349.1 type II secretion system F family protein [Galbibacter sp. EGI 63066]